MIGIYKIVNLKNGKMYIGQSKNIERRWITHKNSANCPKTREFYTPIHKAIRKYGISNFEMIILEQCNIADLSIKEKYYIDKYKTNNAKYGYNMTKGGKYYPAEYRPKLNHIYQIDIASNEIINEFLSSCDAGKRLNIDYKQISNCLHHKFNRKTYKGYKWVFVKEYKDDRTTKERF